MEEFTVNGMMSGNEHSRTSARESYETPTAPRLDGIQPGIGDCGTGSGDSNICTSNGNFASKTCIGDGSGSDESCSGTSSGVDH